MTHNLGETWYTPFKKSIRQQTVSFLCAVGMPRIPHQTTQKFTALSAAEFGDSGFYPLYVARDNPLIRFSKTRYHVLYLEIGVM